MVLIFVYLYICIFFFCDATSVTKLLGTNFHDNLKIDTHSFCIYSVITV